MKKSDHRKGKETNVDRGDGILSGWHLSVYCFASMPDILFSH